jgi:hypothetical protein
MERICLRRMDFRLLALIVWIVVVPAQLLGATTLSWSPFMGSLALVLLWMLLPLMPPVWLRSHLPG